MQRLALPFLLIIALALGLAPSADAAIINISCGGGPLGNITASPGDVVIVTDFCSSGFVVNGLNDVLIVGAEDPTFTGAYPAGLGTGAPPNPLIWDGGNSCGIIRNSSNITVVGFIFEFCGGHGITVENSSDIHIGGNSFWGSDLNGIEVFQSQRVEIFGNYVRNAANPGAAGIHVGPSSRFAQIHDNRVLFNDDGIVVEGDRATVTLNEVDQNVRRGIVVDNSRLSTVSRNTVTDNDPGTPQIYYTTQPVGAETCVAGNDTQLGPAGILAFGGSPPCEDHNS